MSDEKEEAVGSDGGSDGMSPTVSAATSVSGYEAPDRSDLLPEEVADEYRKAYGCVPDTSKQLQAFAKKYGWSVKYTDAQRIVKLLSSERIERKKDVIKATVTTDYIPTSEYESSSAPTEDTTPVRPASAVAVDPGQVAVRYGTKTLVLDMPEGVYPLGELRRDIIRKGFLDATAQLVAFKINGKMVSKYSTDVKTMRERSGGIRVEIIDPEQQKAKKLGTTHDRLKREDPRRREKAALQTEFMRVSVTR